MFCNVHVQPTRTPFYNLNRLHRFTMLPSHLYSSSLLEFLKIFKNLALLGIHFKNMYPYTLYQKIYIQPFPWNLWVNVYEMLYSVVFSTRLTVIRANVSSMVVTLVSDWFHLLLFNCCLDFKENLKF